MNKSNYIILLSHLASSFPFVLFSLSLFSFSRKRFDFFCFFFVKRHFMFTAKLCQSIFLTSYNFSFVLLLKSCSILFLMLFLFSIHTRFHFFLLTCRSQSILQQASEWKQTPKLPERIDKGEYVSCDCSWLCIRNMKEEKTDNTIEERLSKKNENVMSVDLNRSTNKWIDLAAKAPENNARFGELIFFLSYFVGFRFHSTISPIENFWQPTFVARFFSLLRIHPSWKALCL